MEAVPQKIKPASLGLTATQKLRSIAKLEPNLANAQALFLQESKNTKGKSLPFGPSAACKVLALVRASKPLVVERSTSNQSKGFGDGELSSKTAKEVGTKDKKASNRLSKEPQVGRGYF